jgi:hypothetical protein
MKSSFICTAVVFAPFFGVTASWAQDARDPALAEQLFKSAQTCLAANDWACACSKFSASMEADPSVSTQINIAKCQEHDGKLTLAWTTLQDALKLNRTITYSDESRRTKLGEYAQKVLDALEPRIPKLRISVTGRPEGLQIRRNGKIVPLGALDESIRVDPGEHEIVAEAPGFATERRTVKLAERAIEEISLTLTKAAPAPAPTGVAVPKEGPDEPRTSKVLPTPPSPSDGWRRPAGFAIAGAGGAGLLAAGILGVVTVFKSDAANSSDACKSPTDNPRIMECNSLRDTARGFQTAGIATAVASGVLAAAGVVLVATAPRGDGRESASRWSLVAQPMGVSLIGQY